MIINNPTLGPGNGKIGGLVGYARGDKQILRAGFIPKSVDFPRNVRAQNVMRQASNFWLSIPEQRKEDLAAYAASFGAYTSYTFWLPCIMRAIVANGGIHYNCLNFLSSNFDYYNFYDRFLNYGLLSPNWQCLNQANQPTIINLVNAYFEQGFNSLVLEFQAQNQQDSFQKFWNGNFEFGLEINLKLSYRARTGSIRLFISNEGYFQNADVFQALTIQDMNIFWSSFLFPPDLAETLSIEVNLICNNYLYQSQKLGEYSRIL